MRRSTKKKAGWVTILAWVFGVLWLLGWLGGGIALMLAEHIWTAVFCYAMSPVFLIIDILRATRDED